MTGTVTCATLGAMATPFAPPALPGSSSPVVEPASVSSPKDIAVFGLGEVLKTLIHNAGAFSAENDVLKAVGAVDNFLQHFTGGINPATVNALGDMRASVEDVSQRIPPGGYPAVVQQGITLDYTKLAQAILAEQQKAAAITQG